MLLSFPPLMLIRNASLLNSICAALAFCQVESKCLVHNLVCLRPGLFVTQDDQSGDFVVFDLIHNFLALFILTWQEWNQIKEALIVNERDQVYLPT